MHKVAVVGGAGYTGGALIEWILAHPKLTLSGVGSRSQSGKQVSSAHPKLRGALQMSFSRTTAETIKGADAVFLAVAHGDGMQSVDEILSLGFSGPIVDLSADFRLPTADEYATWYKKDHVRSDLLADAFYGMPEITGPPPPGTWLVANPGCFATAVSLAVYPIAQEIPHVRVSITALTGASGSGVMPSTTTHFPERDGNVRAYNVLRHRHLAEIEHMVGPDVVLAFVPVSGPWTNGIWGTATVELPEGVTETQVGHWFEKAYGDWNLIRMSSGELPELRHVVHTPFCDLGWIVGEQSIVVGFALDNLMKGAATQAIQNLNLLLGWEDWTGLLPEVPKEVNA